jgi:UDP-2,3-diacylglucosamine hydrolase
MLRSIGMYGVRAMISEIKKAYFVGDVHLDFRLPERESAFCKLMDIIKDDLPDAVFLMGDIFEFWFGYKTLMFAKTIRAVSKIAELASLGVRVFYIAGNHDFYPGPVFSDYLKTEIKMEPFIQKMGSHTVYLSHGDEINSKDYGYRFLKSLIRNRAAQAVFKCIPASFAWRIGGFTSNASRKLTDFKAKIPDDIYNSFLEAISLQGVDTIIHGHTHDPGVRAYRSGKAALNVINSGHWFGKGHYVIFRNDEFQLIEFPFA